VTGPALLFFAVEQGDRFAGQAAQAALVALVAVSASAVAYAWASLRAPWWMALLASWAAFAAVSLALLALRWSAVGALAVALPSFAAAARLLPAAGPAGPGRARPPWDLPVRMLSAVALVLLVTGLAHRLGPGLSGAFTPFPVALSVLLAFSHAQQGSGAAIRLLHGFFPGMVSFAVFCFVATLALGPLGAGPGFALALGALVPVQGLVLWWAGRRWAPAARRAHG
jgi:hypothetical protein